MRKQTQKRAVIYARQQKLSRRPLQSSYQKTWFVRNTPAPTQNTEYWAICFSSGFMSCLFFSGGKELCIFQIFLTSVQAAATGVLNCSEGPPKITSFHWTLSEIPHARNRLMERYKWAILCGVVFYPLFLSLPPPLLGSLPSLGHVVHIVFTNWLSTLLYTYHPRFQKKSLLNWRA